MSPDGSNLTQFTTIGNVSDACYSSDGTRIVGVVRPGATTIVISLGIIAANGGDAIALTGDALSPHGR